MCGIAADISPIEKIIVKNMTMIRSVPISIAPQPVVPRPTFQPEKSPEMTAAMPSPHSPHTPADRRSWRFSK